MLVADETRDVNYKYNMNQSYYMMYCIIEWKKHICNNS